MQICQATETVMATSWGGVIYDPMCHESGLPHEMKSIFVRAWHEGEGGAGKQSEQGTLWHRARRNDERYVFTLA